MGGVVGSINGADADSFVTKYTKKKPEVAEAQVHLRFVLCKQSHPALKINF
jgi:hypothetical protein